MTAKFWSVGKTKASDRDDGRAGSNSPFDGSQLNAQLAAEIGRCLQSRYTVPSKEPLPAKLAALVHRLREQYKASPPAERTGRHAD